MKMAMDMEMLAPTLDELQHEKNIEKEMTFNMEKVDTEKTKSSKNKFKGKGVGILGKLLTIAKAEKQAEDKLIQEKHPINHTKLRIVEKPLLIDLAVFGVKNPKSNIEVNKAKKIQRVFILMR